LLLEADTGNREIPTAASIANPNGQALFVRHQAQHRLGLGIGQMYNLH